ncbi:hypothetical protein Purlil1_12211 [Purpureocillium lilacinum]|uniref:Uncharacterized protein n=1 Tax=Purpureocillium lilacinum TaxID=33203 RepID=A0ABR0BHE6_PURLI|nr:hypothetical protein Purlil1_12211 [Purpureocillium lilacinum]
MAWRGGGALEGGTKLEEGATEEAVAAIGAQWAESVWVQETDEIAARVGLPPPANIPIVNELPNSPRSPPPRPPPRTSTKQIRRPVIGLGREACGGRPGRRPSVRLDEWIVARPHRTQIRTGSAATDAVPRCSPPASFAFSSTFSWTSPTTSLAGVSQSASLRTDGASLQQRAVCAAQVKQASQAAGDIPGPECIIATPCLMRPRSPPPSMNPVANTNPNKKKSDPWPASPA